LENQQRKIKGLDELKTSLLYNKIIDVWESLCEEKDMKFEDHQNFSQFLQHLKKMEVNINKLPVCANEEGERDKLSKRSSAFFGDPMKTFVIKTDSNNIKKIRDFTIK